MEKIYIILLLLLFHTNLIFSDEPRIINVESYNIKSVELKNILDSLIQTEKRCKHFEQSRFWKINVIKNYPTPPAQKIRITLTDFIGTPDGYIDENGTIILLYDINVIDKFFLKTQDTKTFKDFGATVMIGDDYSTWFYFFDNNKLILDASYPNECIEK